VRRVVFRLFAVRALQEDVLALAADEVEHLVRLRPPRANDSVVLDRVAARRKKKEAEGLARREAVKVASAVASAWAAGAAAAAAGAEEVEAGESIAVHVDTAAHEDEEEEGGGGGGDDEEGDKAGTVVRADSLDHFQSLLRCHLSLFMGVCSRKDRPPTGVATLVRTYATRCSYPCSLTLSHILVSFRCGLTRRATRLRRRR
jgi:hypothetical protein